MVSLSLWFHLVYGLIASVPLFRDAVLARLKPSGDIAGTVTELVVPPTRHHATSGLHLEDGDT